MAPLVRVRDTEPGRILIYLEVGMTGVVVPDVHTADDVLAAVNAVKYPPLGARAAGSATRAARYGLTSKSPAYYQRANEETVVLGMVESEAGIANLPQNLSVEGLDGMSMGKGDLALSIGRPGETDHADVLRRVAEAKEQIRASEKALGVMVSSPATAVRTRDEGATYITLNLGGWLAQAGKAYLDEVRGAG